MTDLLFFGSSDLSLAVLEELEDMDIMPLAVVTRPDKPQGRHLKMLSTPVKEWALTHGIPVIDSQSKDGEHFYKDISSYDVDLFLTVAYGGLLSSEILAIPKLGALNIHPSLLPKYRGASPVQSAIIAGERISGVSLMLMEEGMDTGPVLAQRELIIPDDINSGEMMDVMAVESRYLIRKALPLFLKNELDAKAQDESQVSYCRILTREDGRIDFSESAQNIHNLIRGLNPWPGAFTYMENRRVKLFSSRISSEKPDNENLSPGSIFCKDERFFVVCGQGVLELLEMQFASKSKIRCASCAHNYTQGYRFESYPESANK